ncbi:MAG: molybdopterin molybdenumtransferase MoeA [Gammaproteobacteria bacterium]|nr:MAG: molybdopterin molybdenumtransferase MoeA [Gammaproteobacteria bacterium]
MNHKTDPHDCCGPDDDVKPLSVDQALQRIVGLVEPLAGQERVATRAALGRVLASDVNAVVDVPPYTNSAMDGFALRGDDLDLAASDGLRLIGESFAGHPFAGTVGAGECVRIMTGAVMPDGADTVVMQEATNVDGDTVHAAPGGKHGMNVRQAGEDLRAGGIALTAGTRLKPVDIGLLASVGIAEVPVWRRIRVAFFSTGDELCSIGEPLREGCLFDSNRYTLYGMLTRLGAEVIDLGVIRDTREAIEQAFRDAAAMADVVITSGGVSVGEADFVKETLDRLGGIDFWRIAMKPGKPLAFGRLDEGAYFFGLPGNPVSVMVTFYQFVQPALRRLAGEQSGPELWLRAPCLTRLKKSPGRTEFQRGVLTTGPDGQLAVQTTGAQGSGVLHSMSIADCFIRLPEDSGDVEPGTVVDVQPFNGIV